MSARLWVVSAPNEDGRSAFTSIKTSLDDNTSLCTAYQFHLPTLRVGTLDSLIAVADAISRDDKMLESSVERVLRQYRDLAPEAALPFVDGVDLLEYATDFEWDEAKFASTDSLADIRKAIVEQVTRLEEDMKIRLNDFTSTRQALSSIERRAQGNLMTRALSTVVEEQDVVSSDHLTTLFVVFTAYNEKDFLSCYEQLAEYVVPRSANKVTADSELCLYRVVLFKTSVETFKAACRDRRYTAREFTFDPAAQSQSAEEELRLKQQADEQTVTFTKWAETAFAETFIAMVHLKALRAFAESVLRYGLPVNFDVALLLPKGRSDSRLRAALNEMFGHLGGSWAAAGDADDVTNIPGIVGDKDFYPYVYFEFPLPQPRSS